MALDRERTLALQQALQDHDLAGFISPYASEVLLCSGYWPIMNASIVLLSRSGETVVIVPEDEADLAQSTTSARVVPYKATTLKALRSSMEGFTEPLLKALRSLGLDRGKLGLQQSQSIEPVSYIVSTEYRSSLRDLLQQHAPNLTLVPADSIIERLKAAKTPGELQSMRLAARIASNSFQAAGGLLRAGLRESEVAGALQRIFEDARQAERADRSYGYFFCMSGPNSALASAAYARTRQRVLQQGDLVMIHANTCCDGFWTDITRTYTVGEPTPRHDQMRSAIMDARAAALHTVRPGVRAREVDHAARSIMEQRGFGEAFRHATGHGVGFAAANGNAEPRIHPVSEDILTEGMTFNVEPAAYFADYGGMRHCDVVAVGPNGPEVLTDFP